MKYIYYNLPSIKALASILGTPEEFIRQKIDDRINELKKEIAGI